jgi:hypothetical protein
MMIVAVLVIVLLPYSVQAACTGASPSWSCATRADAQTLVNETPVLIQAGDTVTLTQSESWTGPLIVNESKYPSGPFVPPFHLTCSPGVTLTRDVTFTTGTPAAFLVIEALSSTTGVYRFSNCTIDGASLTGSFAYVAIYARGLDKFRVDHITVNNVKTARAFSFYGDRTGIGLQLNSGVFDHNVCNTAASSNVQCFGSSGQWSRDNHNEQFQFSTLGIGTNEPVYWEDNVCNFHATAVGDDCTDGFDGFSAVWRYNTFNYGYGVHGADSGARGSRLTEVYRNTFVAPIGNHYLMNNRTGPDIAFDNVATNGTFTWSTIIFTLYRTLQPLALLAGKCDGSSSWDGNTGSGTPAADGVAPTGNPGYPCMDQTGWYFAGDGASPTGGTQIHRPAYLWGNRIAGALANYVQNDGPAGSPCTPPSCGVYSTNYITPNVDFYVDNGASCSGASCTTGVGVGALASRPSSCTTGVGYWATDQGSWNKAPGGEQGVLYKCTATNTWTSYYTPYEYPHPLQGYVAPSGSGGMDLAKVRPGKRKQRDVRMVRGTAALVEPPKKSERE